MTKERAPGAGVVVGGGIAIGAALGMLIGLLLSAELWLMVGIGVVAGLLRVVVADREISEIEWKPAARPFLGRQRECPQGGSSTRPLSDEDPLQWYVA